MQVTQRSKAKNAIARKVHKALQILMERDIALIRDDANERSISHKLAEYLQQQFKQWHVDCEYNRDGFGPKRLNLNVTATSSDDTHARTVFPDIIVHKRKTRANLLVIEVKKASSPVRNNFDLMKLRAFKRQLRYPYAVSILFTGPEANKPPYKDVWL